MERRSNTVVRGMLPCTPNDFPERVVREPRKNYLLLLRFPDGHGRRSLPARSTLSSNQFFEAFETEAQTSN
jgi:hypothetical protein